VPEMTLEVWKYPVTFKMNAIRMPYGAYLLDVQLQGGNPVLWARVDPAHERTTRFIYVCGTGHAAPQGQHVATWQEGSLVWHAFDCGEEVKP
jgi:hypothetical protein